MANDNNPDFQSKQISDLQLELADLKTNYKMNLTRIYKILNVLIGQDDTKSLGLNDLLNLEDK